MKHDYIPYLHTLFIYMHYINDFTCIVYMMSLLMCPYITDSSDEDNIGAWENETPAKVQCTESPIYTLESPRYCLQLFCKWFTEHEYNT